MMDGDYRSMCGGVVECGQRLQINACEMSVGGVGGDYRSKPWVERDWRRSFQPTIQAMYAAITWSRSWEVWGDDGLDGPSDQADHG
jgi:hypothetical protein